LLCLGEKNSEGSGELISNFAVDQYGLAVRFASALSGLYSSNDAALIDSRFVEKLFCSLTNSFDLARSDVSFDAIFDNTRGVGVKTFLAPKTGAHKYEKVAEFTRASSSLSGLEDGELTQKVAELRNARIESDAAQFGIDLRRSFYHCLVRSSGSAFVHEEPYSLVSLDSIIHHGARNETTPTPKFSDGVNEYSYSRSKNVLFKKFMLDQPHNSPQMATPIITSIWPQLLDPESPLHAVIGSLTLAVPTPVASDDFVILPLYSTANKTQKTVAPFSGINQWNAAGRVRKFGEAYIPIPKLLHRMRPSFFPARDTKFELRLPTGQIVQSKLCQADSKALMSDPNDTLCSWLFATIDGNLLEAQSRLAEQRPYTYADLEKVGRDSVKLKRSVGKTWDFELEMAEFGAYEQFISEGGYEFE
jgi:hypothetical protein